MCHSRTAELAVLRSVGCHAVSKVQCWQRSGCSPAVVDGWTRPTDTVLATFKCSHALEPRIYRCSYKQHYSNGPGVTGRDVHNILYARRRP